MPGSRLQKSWSGHFECLIPTALHASGLSIEDFGGNGEFVKSCNINKYYFNNPIDPNHQPGSFTVSANTFDPASAPPLLHHPVKY